MTEKQVYLQHDSSVMLSGPFSFSLTGLTTILKKPTMYSALTGKQTNLKGRSLQGSAAETSSEKQQPNL